MSDSTVVVASLSDDELQKSINNMVANFDKGLQKMVNHTNTKVDEIKRKLTEIGNINFGSKFTTDTGNSKRISSNNSERKSVENLVNSYYHLLGAFKFAQRTERLFSGKNIFSLNREELGRYQKAVEDVIKLKPELDKVKGMLYYENAEKISKSMAFDTKSSAKGFRGSIDERLTQLNNYYAKQEKLSQKAAQEEERQRQKRVAAMEKESAAQKKMIDDQYKLSFARAMRIPTDQLDLAQTKLERLQVLLRDMRERGILSNTQIASTEAEIRKLEQKIGQVNTAQQQATSEAQKQSSVINTITKETESAAEAEKLRLNYIKETAREARTSMQRYQSSAYLLSDGDRHGYVYAENDARAKGLSIEEQIAKIIEQQNAATRQVLDNEKSITQEVAKRKDYVKPRVYEQSVTDASLRGFVGYKLGLKPGDVISSDAASSIKTVTAELKQLQDTYTKMTAFERNSAWGQTLKRRFQEVQRQSQQLRTQMSRPISLKDALSGSEKTLDDIAYKMQRLRSYKQGIDLTNPNASNKIKQVDEALARLQKDADKWMSKSQEMIKSNTALGRSWNYMKNRLAFYFTIGASTQFIKNLVDVRSQYEMNERALGILINSAERGTQIFNELSQMALVSPYTLIELSSAAKQLTAYDVAAKDVVDTTRRLADMAAAVGIPIERLTYALGQIKAYGYLNSRDARMFANAGIPLVKQLSDYYTELEGKLVSTADVYDRIKKKAIDYNEVMDVMYKMTDKGGKFFDFQAKMADTLKVRLANLTLAWNNMLNDMGKESQGVLNWGIGALRELFLHWKQFDSLLKDAAWALGIRTYFMYIAWCILKVGAALGVTNKQMALSSVFGTRLAGVLKNVALSMKTIVTSPLTWWSLLAIVAVEAAQAIFGVNEAQKALNESIRNGAKDNYDNISQFLEQYKEVRDSLYKTQKEFVGTGIDTKTNKTNKIYKEKRVGQDIDQNEAKKAWEAIREQIELTVASSDKYIENLLSISNMSERVRQGFNLLEDVQVVNAALKELDDDTIKVSKDFSDWWNLGLAPDGLIGNLKDLQEEIQKLRDAGINPDNELTKLIDKDYATALERFRNDLQKTTDSVLDFINLKGWSGDESKINQVFEQISQKLVLDNQLDPQKAFTLQIEVEEARSKAAREALKQRISDEKAAYEISHDEQLRQSINADVARYNSWNETNGRSKVEWERFTKWLKEQHISETTAMFRNMDEEDIKSLNFQEGKHAEWVTRMVTQYAKEHKMSYDEAFKYLRSWVRNANQWSVFIPLIISSEDKKSVYDQLGEYDKAIDDADAQIERLTRRIRELNAKKKKSKEETKELTKAEEELAQAQKDKASAEAKGGHGKKEKKDEKAANKAANKAGKQAESELQKALKDEIALINNARSSYDKLAKAGYKNKDILSIVSKQFGSTIAHINKVLGKNGIPLFDINSISGADNPKLEQKMLKAQIDAAKKARRVKPSEIKDLEVEYSKVTVDAKAFDFSQLTKQLDEQMDNFSKEYELSLSIDEDVETGELFADMLGLNTETLPKTAKQYTDGLTDLVNKYLASTGSKLQLKTVSLTKGDLSSLRELVKTGELTQVAYDKIKVASEKSADAEKKEIKERAKDWNELLEKYSEYEYKRKDIAKKANKERVNLIKQFGSEDQAQKAEILIKRIDLATDEETKNRLKEQLEELIADVTKDDETKARIAVSITNKEEQDTAAVDFEEYKNGADWLAAMEDAAKLSDKALKRISKDLRDILETKQELTPTELKEINSVIEKMDEELTKRNPFGALADKLSNLKKSKEALQLAKDEKRAADGAVVEAAESDNAYKFQKARKRQDKANENLKKSEDNYNSSVRESAQAMRDAIGASEDMWNSMDNLQSLLGDTAKDAISAGFGIASGMTTAWEAIKEGQNSIAILAIIQMALQAINFLTGVLGGKKDTFTPMKGQVENLASVIDKVSESQKKMLENSVGVVAMKKYKQLLENNDMIINSYRELAKAAGESGSSAGSHSYAYRTNRALADSWDKINKKVGVSVHSIQDFYNLAPEKLKEVMELMPAEWSKIDEDIRTSLEKIIEYGDKSVEYAEAIGKALTNVTLDDVTNDFESMLQDMESDAEKFSESMEENLRNAIIRSMMINTYSKQLEDWYKNFQQSMEDSSMSKDEADSLKDEYMEIVKKALEERNALVSVIGTGGDKSLSALQQGIQGVTEDTASAIEAYMNGVSQQVYLHSSLLTQIRDILGGVDADAQLSIQGEMLLQLQQSYQTQQAIQSILEGWNNSSGRAVRVELIS